MTKNEVKKYIQSLDRDSLEQLVLDLYSSGREVKDYLDYSIHPNDQLKLEELKAIIISEFSPKRRKGKMRFSVCRNAVKRYRLLDPVPELMADLMLYIPECALKVLDTYGDLGEAFLNRVYCNFVTALKYINAHGLQSLFRQRIDSLVAHCEFFGWGIPDQLRNASQKQL